MSTYTVLWQIMSLNEYISSKCKIDKPSVGMKVVQFSNIIFVRY